MRPKEEREGMDPSHSYPPVEFSPGITPVATKLKRRPGKPPIKKRKRSPFLSKEQRKESPRRLHEHHSSKRTQRKSAQSTEAGTKLALSPDRTQTGKNLSAEIAFSDGLLDGAVRSGSFLSLHVAALGVEDFLPRRIQEHVSFLVAR
jgi:hypothetical protein